MPPVNQGSRSTMITWMVVASVLFVTSTVFAIYFYVGWSRADEDNQKLTGSYKEVVAGAALQGADISALRDARKDPSAADAGITSNMTLLDVALRQRDSLAAKIAGPNKSYPDALAFIQSLGARAQKLGIPANQTDSLGAAANALAGQLEARQREVAALQQQLTTANATVKNKIQEMDAARGELDKALAAARDEASGAM